MLYLCISSSSSSILSSCIFPISFTVLVSWSLVPTLSAASIVLSVIKYWSFAVVVPVVTISRHDNIEAAYISSGVSLSSIGQIFFVSQFCKVYPSNVSLNILILKCACVFISPGIQIFPSASIIYAPGLGVIYSPISAILSSSM